MTLEEKIKEAAQKYVGFIGVEDKITLKDAFKIGAEWVFGNQWHSVASGDLPQNDYAVLCQNDIELIVGYFSIVDKCFYDADSDDRLTDVKYWMEIPQLPKKGGEK
ncbi:hypothetical protein [Alloprevotella tannerae]